MAPTTIGKGSSEFELVLPKSGEDQPEALVTVRADKAYMSRDGAIVFYEGSEVFYGLASGQWVRFCRKDSA